MWLDDVKRWYLPKIRRIKWSCHAFSITKMKNQKDQKIPNFNFHPKVDDFPFNSKVLSRAQLTIAMSEHLHLSANKWLVQHQFFPSNYYSKWMFGDFENGAELIAADKSILLSFFQLQKSNDRRSKRPWRRTTTLKNSTIAIVANNEVPSLAPSSKQDMVSHLPFFGIPGATTIYNFDARSGGLLKLKRSTNHHFQGVIVLLQQLWKKR